MLKPGFEKKIPEERETKESSELAASKKIRARIRFDYQGKARPSRFLFGRKSTEEAAEELREKQAALWQNVPVQGVYIEKIDLGEIYTVYDEESDEEIAFAPLEMVVTADSAGYLVRFAVREEFRRIKILEPDNIALSIHDLEQIFFEIHNQTKSQLIQKIRRYAE
jgi:hypothetical protein